MSEAQIGKKQSTETIEKRMSKIRGRKINLSPDALKKKSEYMKLRPVKEETKLKISIANSGRKFSEEAKLRLKNNLAENYSDWLAANAKTSNWILAIKIYDINQEFPTYREDRIARLIGCLPHNIKTVFRKVLSGWNPNEDEKYQNWLKSL